MVGKITYNVNGLDAHGTRMQADILRNDYAHMRLSTRCVAIYHPSMPTHAQIQ